MKSILRKIILFVPVKYLMVGVIVLYSCFAMAQSKKMRKSQSRYASNYEKASLKENKFPLMMPYNRWVAPAGKLVYFGDHNLENHALDCAVSPDNKWLAVEGRYSVVILSADSFSLVQRVPTKTLVKDPRAANTYSGITWRQTGSNYQLFWSATGSLGKAYVIKATWDGKKIKLGKKYEFMAKKPAATALPNELVITREDEADMLYVVLNGNNELVKLNANTGDIIWTSPTGVAPYGIVLANNQLYVTNWAGSVPDSQDRNVAGIPWGKAKVDSLTGATREGTVSVMNPADGSLIKDITVGLHPNDIVASADEKFVYVANANSDFVSVINTLADSVAENIAVRLGEKNNPYFGDSPNGLGLSEDGKTLYVANGMDNALAVIELSKAAATNGRAKSNLMGFIPTGAYPGAVCVFQNHTLIVPNIEANGARIPMLTENSSSAAFNSHHMIASVSIIPIPDRNQLIEYTNIVKKTNQYFRIALSKKTPRRNAKPVPVPERIGEPSVFQHVVYIIKENRTYDQVLGDHPGGDGDTSLCVFGRQVTPNIHKISDDFLLLDNFYAAGKSSAEGHQWTDMAMVTDYIEKNVRGWFRSYPHVQQDAMVYAPTGFIWDNALRHGKSVRIYGEACVPLFDKKATWSSIYNGFLNEEKFQFKNVSTIAPARPLISQNYPGYDSHKIPDVLRARTFIAELKDYEAMEGDQWPSLLVVALPNDHTGGTRPGLPTPRAMVADNDLALGQILEAITKSKFWKNTVVFVTEDDSQAGWDHVSAYRTVGLVASPYSKLHKTINTNYNQVSMVRTIEQILGIPPMNIQDATASPMFHCFGAAADTTKYASVPNEIPLNEMNKKLSELKGKEKQFARKSISPQFDHIDGGNDALLNKILWFATRGKLAYPEKYSSKEEEDD